MKPILYKQSLVSEGVALEELSDKGKRKVKKINELLAKRADAESSKKIVYCKNGQRTPAALRIMSECEQEIADLDDELLDEIAFISVRKEQANQPPVHDDAPEVVEDEPSDDEIIDEDEDEDEDEKKSFGAFFF